MAASTTSADLKKVPISPRDTTRPPVSGNRATQAPKEKSPTRATNHVSTFELLAQLDCVCQQGAALIYRFFAAVKG